MSINLVREFHDAFGQPDADEPTVDNQQINALRIRLLREELDELSDALQDEDLVATLDALTDLQYVLDGSYLQLGFAAMKNEALLEVHKTNMAKLGPNGLPMIRHDGKVLKPEGWRAPNLSAVIRRHKRGGES
jgi:predicted HAD superfamily Cof-like phosphohydrolase